MLFVKSYCLLLAGSTLLGTALAAPGNLSVIPKKSAPIDTSSLVVSISDGIVRRTTGSIYSVDDLNHEVLRRDDGKANFADHSKGRGGHRGVDVADGFKARRDNSRAKPADNSKLRGGHRGVDIADGFKVRRDNDRTKPTDHSKLRGGHRGVDIADGF